ncbi:MAG: DegV family EDD domain-containing protein, partial [Clostridiales bacterium]|nr:DegV family EDD domain-containing protein [Clostridiales bacterium]
MNNYVLSCCSTADLNAAHFQSRNISYICFHFSLNDQQYADDLGQSISFPDFYQAMRDGADTKTSQVNEGEYTAYFTPFLENGQDIVHVCLSSGISGSCNSARLAAEELTKKYPQRKIYVIDSLGASSGFGLLMDKLADLRDSGMDAAALADWTQKNRLQLHHWFFSTDLTFFVKGGRISRTAGFLGTMLRLCPLMNMDNEGHLIPR